MFTHGKSIRSLTASLASISLLVAAGCGDDDDEPRATGVPATDAPAATDAPVETEAPAETDAPVETEAPAGTDAPVETEAPAGTDAPVETDAPVDTEPPMQDLAVRSGDVRVRQVHEATSVPEILFEVFPNALSAIIVFGENVADGCRFVAVHDANGDGVLGPGDEAAFGAGVEFDTGAVAIAIDRGGRYFLVKDEAGTFPVGVLGDDVVVDGAGVTVGGTMYGTVGLSPDGERPAAYDVDFVPENEVMPAM